MQQQNFEKYKHIIIIMSLFGTLLYLFEFYKKEDIEGYGQYVSIGLLLIAGFLFFYYYIKKKPIQKQFQQRQQPQFQQNSIQNPTFQQPQSQPIPPKQDVFKEFESLK